MTACSNVAIIGAGPYGLSIASHLRERGIDFRIFGNPMHCWRARMPKGMFLKSEGCASSLSDPRPPGTTCTGKRRFSVLSSVPRKAQADRTSPPTCRCLGEDATLPFIAFSLIVRVPSPQSLPPGEWNKYESTRLRRPSNRRAEEMRARQALAPALLFPALARNLV